jgi:hypothetical protein
MPGYARKAFVSSMTVLLAALSVVLFGILTSGEARALDKVDPYICPTKDKGSAIDCFLEAIPQTYTMCRNIKSIEIIEFGMAGSQEGVNGAKTDSCIDKHKLSVNLPYQASLRTARNPAEVQSLRKLYATWLDSMAKLHPTAGEDENEYKERVVRAYDEFSAQTKGIHALMDAPLPAAVKHPPKKAPPKT